MIVECKYRVNKGFARGGGSVRGQGATICAPAGAVADRPCRGRGLRSGAVAAVWCLVFLLAVGDVLAAGKRAPGEAVVVGLNVLPGGGRARIEVVSIGRIDPHVYQVGGPDRLVVDAVGLVFRLSHRRAMGGSGVVRDVRYGQLGERRARIVADLGPGTRIASVANERFHSRLHRVRIDLSVENLPRDDVVRAAMGGVGRLRPRMEEDREDDRDQASNRRPVVVIDPGHGGIDPGAVVNRTQLEKAIVLAVGLKVARLLREADEVDVVMTRERDVFLTLDERIERSLAAKGDLFLSLHADAVDEGIPALAAGGASVYILSKRASDAVARRLAEKENAADRFAGIPAKRSADRGVRTILVDLLKRETESESKRLRTLLVAEIRDKLALAREPMRSAAFHVLKQTATPAALIELGFMTNPVDLGLMRQEGWRDRMAGAIAEAVHRFFRERR